MALETSGDHHSEGSREAAICSSRDFAARHFHVDDLRIVRGARTLVRELSFRLERGTFLAVTGPSGIGKSSLLACLSGHLQPESGEISFSCRHQCIHSPRDYRKRVGVVFQNLLLVPSYTVEENILCGRLARHSWPSTLLGFPKSDRQAVAPLLDELEIRSLGSKKVRSISGGEQQRTAVARAMFQEPELLLADEPVSQLVPKLARRTLDFVRREAAMIGTTVVCMLHQADLVEEFANYELSLGAGDGRDWRFRELAA